jgi:very-short-patch-repair endonuclease
MPVSWPQPVVAVRRTSRREPAGITVLREEPPDHDVVLLDGLVVTCRARSIVDCLRLLPEEPGRALLDRALQQGWIGFAELVARTQELVGRRGVPRLRRHLRVASWGSRSEAERRLRRLLLVAGVRGWRAEHPVPGVGVVDLAFPELRLAIEVDGRAWHVAADRFQLDRSRQNALVDRGWTVLRFTWEDLERRPTEVLSTIRRTVARLAA